MREARVADPAEARRRRVPRALCQQVAQVTGLVVLLAIVTLLARRLSLAELGTYGLMATLAGYLLVLKNSIAAAALRAMAAATGDTSGRATFSTAAVLYAAVGAGHRRADRRGRRGLRGRDPGRRPGERGPARRASSSGPSRAVGLAST